MKLTMEHLILLDDIREKLIQALDSPSENHQFDAKTTAPNGDQIEVRFTACLSKPIESAQYLAEIFGASTSDEERLAILNTHQFSVNKHYNGTPEQRKPIQPIVEWWAMYCMGLHKEDKEAT